MRCSSFAAGVPAGSMARILSVAKIIGAGLVVSACASSHASYETPSNVGMQPSHSAVAAAPRVELEDDGLAVQAPPRVRKQSEPDDPSEPFSPNYGPRPPSSEPSKEPAENAISRQRNADARPLILHTRTTPMSAEEAQSLIVKAMIAHEQRNP